jgi:hypothetical protein
MTKFDIHVDKPNQRQKTHKMDTAKHTKTSLKKVAKKDLVQMFLDQQKPLTFTDLQDENRKLREENGELLGKINTNEFTSQTYNALKITNSKLKEENEKVKEEHCKAEERCFTLFGLNQELKKQNHELTAENEKLRANRVADALVAKVTMAQKDKHIKDLEIVIKEFRQKGEKAYARGFMRTLEDDEKMEVLGRWSADDLALQVAKENKELKEENEKLWDCLSKCQKNAWRTREEGDMRDIYSDLDKELKELPEKIEELQEENEKLKEYQTGDLGWKQEVDERTEIVNKLWKENVKFRTENVRLDRLMGDIAKIIDSDRSPD